MQQNLLSSGINCLYIHSVKDIDTFGDLNSSVFHILAYDGGPITMHTINRSQMSSDIKRLERSFISKDSLFC